MRSQGNFLHGRIESLEFDPTSGFVAASGASGDASGAVAVADVSGMPVAVLEGPRGSVRVAHFDPSSRRIVGASSDGSAWVWDASSPYRRWSSPPVSDDCGLMVSPEPDRRYVVIGCRDFKTRVVDTAHDQLIAELPSVTQVPGDFASAFPVLSSTGDRAAIARGDTVAVYALPGGRLVRTIAHGTPVNVVAFARTGHDIVSGAVDGSLLLTRDDRDPVALPRLAEGVDAATIAAGGHVIAAGGKVLRIYDSDQGAVVAELAMPVRAGWLSASPDGQRAVVVPYPTSNEPSSPVLIDLEHDRVVGRLEGHAGRVFSARFVAGGNVLTAGSDGTARLWDGANAQQIQTYGAKSRFFADATLTPDGSMVVAGANDGLLRFWDSRSGRQLWALQAHRSHVIGVHFEGDDIVTRGFSGDVSRWSLPKPVAVIEACSRGDGACGIVAR